LDDWQEGLQRLAQLRRAVAELEERLGLERPPPSRWLTAVEQATVEELATAYAADAITVHAANGDYLFASPSATEITGWSSDELLGRSAYELFHEEDVARIAVDHGGHRQPNFRGRVSYRLRARDGTWRWVETRSTARHGPEGVDLIVAVTRPVEPPGAPAPETGTRAAFARRVAHALAHELNNPLAAVLGNLELVRERVGGDAELTGAFDQIEAALGRAQSVVRQLARAGEAESPPRAVDLADVLRQTVAGLCRDVRVPVRLETEPCPLFVDTARLHQLLHEVLEAHLLAPPDERAAPVRVTCVARGGDAVLEVTGGAPPERRVRADLTGLLRGEALSEDTLPSLTARLAAGLGGTCEHAAGTEPATVVRLPLAR
jgi:PAS domain S-box-containing protein